MSTDVLPARPDRPEPRRPKLRRRALGFAGALALTLGTAPFAGAAPHCTDASDQTTFDVEALKSELIVVATACHDSDEYNAFVQRYQPALAGTESSLDAYFKRTYGRNAQKMHDAFITDLANSQADGMQTMGADFCPRNKGLFTQVMALRDASELPPFAAGQDLIPPTLGACMTPPEPAARKTRSVRHRKHA